MYGGNTLSVFFFPCRHQESWKRYFYSKMWFMMIYVCKKLKTSQLQKVQLAFQNTVFQWDHKKNWLVADWRCNQFVCSVNYCALKY